jgi:hypothetical protein
VKTYFVTLFSQGLVFAWWGAKAAALRKFVEGICSRYPSVRVRHVVHPNPAAQGDIFCDGIVVNVKSMCVSNLFHKFSKRGCLR